MGHICFPIHESANSEERRPKWPTSPTSAVLIAVAFAFRPPISVVFGPQTLLEQNPSALMPVWLLRDLKAAAVKRCCRTPKFAPDAIPRYWRLGKDRKRRRYRLLIFDCFRQFSGKRGSMGEEGPCENWSGREDSNLRPYGPEPYALPNCATPRQERKS